MSAPNDRDLFRVVREFAHACGHYGKPGGWIYTATGQPITQGWWMYERQYHLQFVNWLTQRETAFDNFVTLVMGTGDTYRPTLFQDNARRRVLSDLYDAAQEKRGDARRTYRAGLSKGATR